MAEVILCRHGFTPANNAGWNKQKGIDETIYYDELCPLDEKYGKTQTDELGEFLSEKYKGKKLLVCYSPYYRTRQTMEHVLDKLSKNANVTTCKVDTIREINQGLNYARTKEMFDEHDFDAQRFYTDMKSPYKVATTYLQGESETDVRRRVRRFANQLKDYQTSGEINGEDYDVVVVVTHETVMHSLYYDMYGRPDGLKIPTASAVIADENPEVLFVPETSVPKGYMVDFEDYSDYFRLRYFYDKMLELKSDVKFHAFFGGHIDMPIVEDTVTFEKSGESLTILPGNTDKRGMFLIDCSLGQDAYAYDKKSTSTYYILDGEGEFDINGKIQKVKKGDVVIIPPNTTFYYKGKMQLIEKMTPNFQEENVVVVKPVQYSEKPVYDFMPTIKELDDSHTINS